MTVYNIRSTQISGDALTPGDHDLIAQVGSLIIGDRIPDGWTVTSRSKVESEVARVVSRCNAVTPQDEHESADALPAPFKEWRFAVEARLCHCLDGDQERDGYSIDGALAMYSKAIPVADVVKQIQSDRANTLRRRITAIRHRISSDADKVRTIAARSPDCGEDLAEVAFSITLAESLLLNMESAIR